MKTFRLVNNVVMYYIYSLLTTVLPIEEDVKLVKKNRLLSISEASRMAQKGYLYQH